jgi:hypothetical protein
VSDVRETYMKKITIANDDLMQRIVNLYQKLGVKGDCIYQHTSPCTSNIAQNQTLHDRSAIFLNTKSVGFWFQCLRYTAETNTQWMPLL